MTSLSTFVRDHSRPAIPFANYTDDARRVVYEWAMQHDWARAHGVEWVDGGAALVVRFDEHNGTEWTVVEERVGSMRELRAAAGY